MSLFWDEHCISREPQGCWSVILLTHLTDGIRRERRYHSATLVMCAVLRLIAGVTRPRTPFCLVSVLCYNNGVSRLVYAARHGQDSRTRQRSLIALHPSVAQGEVGVLLLWEASFFRISIDRSGVYTHPRATSAQSAGKSAAHLLVVLE
jgi:hypothetical protein